jgi:glycosyltransferase involved in cell wall biosynthesis
MIVKNESNIIKKCLNSIADYLDYWVICDTGSTDGTQDIIKSFFKEKDIPGELYEDKWVSFGYNRTLYLKYAKNKCDFLIILDADEILIVKNKNFKNNIKPNSQNRIKYYGNLDYRYSILLAGNIQWKYIGVTHEYITTDEKHTVEDNDDIMINHIGNGNNKRDKFTRDIKLLSQGIKDEPNNVRYHFYLAQSYKDIGDYKNAIKYYKKRVEMGGWYEEVYYSLYMIGLCKQNDGLDFENKILYDYLKAYNYNKNRLEALYEIVKYYRQNEKYQEGYAYGMLRIKNSYPKDLLFIDRDIHTFKFKDEVAICASRVNDHKLAIKLNNELLNLDCLNDNYRNRIQKNLNFSLNSDKYAKFTEFNEKNFR